MHPAIRIHSLDEARIALAVAHELRRPVALVSAPSAARHGGPGWWCSLVAAARAEYPGVAMTTLLDCDDSAGDAMASIRAGVERICFRGRPDVAAKLRDMATQRGVVVVDTLPLGLDLRALRDPAAACRVWLREERPHG